MIKIIYSTLLLFIISIFIVFLYYNNFNVNNVTPVELISSNAKLIDLGKPLVPWNLYENISCQETKSINSISILMCLYDENNFVSYNIRNFKIYEPDNIGN
jgi:hypothetical protein